MTDVDEGCNCTFCHPKGFIMCDQCKVNHKERREETTKFNLGDGDRLRKRENIL